MGPHITFNCFVGALWITTVCMHATLSCLSMTELLSNKERGVQNDADCRNRLEPSASPRWKLRRCAFRSAMVSHLSCSPAIPSLDRTVVAFHRCTTARLHCCIFYFRCLILTIHIISKFFLDAFYLLLFLDIFFNPQIENLVITSQLNFSAFPNDPQPKRF